MERGKSKTEKGTHGDYSVEFTVKINAGGDRADARVVVRRNGAVVSEQRAMTALMRPPFAGGG